jgi:hypothetical protein
MNLTSAFTDALLFAAGLLAGFAVHEVGHELAARAYGERLQWSSGKWLCRTPDSTGPCEHLGAVAVAGNLSTAIVGEALLHTEYRGPFIDGMQTYNTINPIQYALKDAIAPGGYADYMEVSSGVKIALAVHAASIGYRHVSKGYWRIDVKGNLIQFSKAF